MSASKTEKVVFHWWIPHTLNMKESMMCQVTSRIRRITRINDIEIHASLKHLAKTRSSNKNNFWRGIMAREMKLIVFAFDMIETGYFTHVGHKRTSGYAMFHVKMDFSQKHR